MRYHTSQSLLAVTLAAGLIGILATPAHATDEDHSCSLERAAGHYSMTDTGTVVGVGPRTTVAVFTLDGHGNLLNGVGTSSLNGSIASETFSGTYAVNSDCNGSMDVKIYSGTTELFEITGFLAFDDNMKEMRAVFTSIVTPDGTALASVIGLQARKQ